MRALAAVRAFLASWAGRLRAAGTLRPILAALKRRQAGGPSWVVTRHLRTLNDVLVSSVAPVGRPALALLKRPTTDAGERGIRRQEVILRELRRQPGLDGWTRAVPSVLASGQAGGRSFLVEKMLPGVSAEKLLRNGGDHQAVITAAEAAIDPLHRGTGMTWRLDEQLLGTLIDEPIERLRPAVAGRSKLARGETALESLRAELRAELKGRTVRTGWVHGDLCPGNVLMAPDGSGPAGLVDWEQSRPVGLPELDRLQLLLTTRIAVRRQELGEVVTDLLKDESWEEAERSLTEGIASNGSAPVIPTRSWLLLAWLHHVAGNVGKSERYARSRVWVRRNVDPVLAFLLRSPATSPGPVPAPAASGPRSPDTRKLAAALAPAAPIGALIAAVVLWGLSLPKIDPRAMTDLGLVAVLPPTFYVALALLSSSLAILAQRRHRRTPLLAGHVAALILFLHGTPAIVYGTLRYSWAWKHVGIVDYIERHGGVNPGIHYGDIYHNWPGFFGLDALVTRLAGLGDTIGVATWGPVFFNVLSAAALLFVFSALTRDRRVVWLGTWLFLIANWVGQDYFSPQAFGFFLYLVVVGVVVRWLRPGSGAIADRRARMAIVAVVLVLVAAIAVSHILTSVMVVVMLAALVLFRVCAVRTLPLLAAAIPVLWGGLYAHDYVARNVASTLESVRLPWQTTSSNLLHASHLSADTQFVTFVSRGLSFALVALAAAGAFRLWRAGRLDRAPVILALSPLLLFAAGDYDGEMIFRIYLFAVPFLAFLGAHALVGRSGSPALRWRVAPVAVGGLVLAAFLVAYYGNDRQYYFTPGEVAAAKYLYSHAPKNSLLIEGTRNSPGQFKNYERFEYVTLSREPRESSAHVLARPASVLSDWMSAPGHRAAYVFISRGQKAEVNSLGALPRGSLTRLERTLLGSPEFRVVYRNRDATIFSLASQPGDQRAAR